MQQFIRADKNYLINVANIVKVQLDENSAAIYTVGGGRTDLTGELLAQLKADLGIECPNTRPVEKGEDPAPVVEAAVETETKAE